MSRILFCFISFLQHLLQFRPHSAFLNRGNRKCNTAVTHLTSIVLKVPEACAIISFPVRLEAAQKAEMIRRVLLETRQDFTRDRILHLKQFCRQSGIFFWKRRRKRVSNLCSICAYKGQFGQCAACTDTCLQSTAYS